MSTDRKYDLVVIGGGTGGLISAMIAAGAGARVALIERDRTGGDCLWTGCVPSKALLAAANTAQGMRNAGRFGIEPVEPTIDFNLVMESLRTSQSTIEPQDSPERLRSQGVDVIEGNARFTGHGCISVDELKFRFRSAIIATGSEPVLPPIEGLSNADPLTTETVWDLDHLPERLAVIGGGPIGCELGQAFSRLGSNVTIIEAKDTLLSGEEPESSRLVTEVLESEGLGIRTGASVSSVSREAASWGICFRDEDRQESDWSGTNVLVAAGRAPRTDDLGLGAVGVALDDDGSVAVDNRMRTSASGIFAVGDVTSIMPFTHVAAQQARVATPNALFGLRSKADYSAVPWATFTDPEIARVGLSEAEAKDRFGEKAKVVKYEYADLDRAIVEKRPAGFAKLIADRHGKLIGATVAGQGAGDAIAEMAAWINRGASISDVSKQVHAYPTMAEGPSRAADAYVTSRFVTPTKQALLKPVLAFRRYFHRKPKCS